MECARQAATVWTCRGQPPETLFSISCMQRQVQNVGQSPMMAGTFISEGCIPGQTVLVASQVVIWKPSQDPE